MNVAIDDAAIPETLVKTDAKTIRLKCQNPADKKKIFPICPHDQTRHFVGAWDLESDEFVLTETVIEPVVYFPEAKAGQPSAPTMVIEDPALTTILAIEDEVERDKHLHTLSVERGVKWDKKASESTRVARIRAAGSTGAK